MVIAAIGVEPPPRYLRPLFRIALARAGSITVRDRQSAAALVWSRQKAAVAADPLFLKEVRRQPVRGERFDAAISLRDDAPADFVENLAAALPPNAKLLAVATDRRPEADAARVRELFDASAADWNEPSRDESWQELVDELAACRVVVSMRLHACIFAVLAGTPVVVVTKDQKTASLADDLGLAHIPLDATTREIESAINSAGAPSHDAIEKMALRAAVAIDRIVDALARRR
jgi:polysaccharide pyruvyl transferase WcaK-like protein